MFLLGEMAQLQVSGQRLHLSAQGILLGGFRQLRFFSGGNLCLQGCNVLGLVLLKHLLGLLLQSV